MQDRFRFRVWNIKNKEMIYNAEIAYDGMNYNTSWQLGKNKNDGWVDCFGYYLDYEHEDYEIMQSTGLKDKNGTLIFEGDIVKITKTTWQKESYSLVYLVCYDTIQWQLGLFKHQRAKAQENRRPDRKIFFKRIVSFDDYTPKRMFAECEVIGNFYENPELLGGAE